MDVSHRASDRHVRRAPHVVGARVCDTSDGSPRRFGRVDPTRPTRRVARRARHARHVRHAASLVGRDTRATSDAPDTSPRLADTSDTPLTRVAYDGYAEPAKLLLAAGAAVDARSEPSGGTALHEAVLHGSSCHNDPGYNNLHGHGIKAGHEEIITLLLAHGAALDLRNHRGETPLLAAVSMGCLHRHRSSRQPPLVR